MVCLKTHKNLSQQVINYSVYTFRLRELLMYVLMALAADAVISYVFYRSVIAFLLFLPVTIIYPIYQRKILVKKRKQRLGLEFKEGIQILAALLSAGYSLENALKESVEEIRLIYGENSMILQEFEYMAHLVYVNVPIEKAFEDFGERSGIDDIRNFAKVVRIAKRSGGELIGIINHTAGVIHDKTRIKEEILTLTAAKRFEQKIMNVFPIFIVVYIDVSSPGFFNAMYQTFFGRVAMSACLLSYIVAMYASAKILEIEV